jgi:hypothetical protein
MQNSLIDHWSYSSLTLFLRNRLAFKKVYINKQYDNLSSPSSVVGTAGHKALEAYYNGTPIPAAIEVGMKHIQNTSDMEIDYGKTGSREKMLKDYTQAINFYFEELPQYPKVLGVELSITEEIKDRSGKVLALPAKAKLDLLIENEDGELWIVDHKFVASHSDGERDDPARIIQAMFCYHTVEAKFGKVPKGITYAECKITKNRDNSPQIQPYDIEFEKHPADFPFFYNIYNDCTKEILKPDVTFLPNFQDMFDGQNSFDIYRQNIIGVEAPVAVNHKTRVVDFVEKSYVPSLTDSVENKNLTPEEKIKAKLSDFCIPVEMQETYIGATITKYTLKPGRGRKMSEFEKHANDLAYALEAENIRIEAPIRGTSLVGVEVPNKERKTIPLSDAHLTPGTMNIPVGVDVYGELLCKDLAVMPHLLIAGATGAGKSVMLNVALTALTKQMSPDQLKLILIDPKRVELSQFRGVPHLLNPVIYDEHEAAKALKWLVEEMEVRYQRLETANVRSIDEYAGMHKIVVVIDEFADLMLSGGSQGRKSKKVATPFGDMEIGEDLQSAEKSIVLLAQKARAVGIHIILATQRPSADVVTGLIKANIPTKICFMTTSMTNSRIVLDQAGAEELTGKGDMLYQDPGEGLKRLQGLYC